MPLEAFKGKLAVVCKKVQRVQPFQVDSAVVKRIEKMNRYYTTWMLHQISIHPNYPLYPIPFPPTG